jgi:hypothetical protein
MRHFVSPAEMGLILLPFGQASELKAQEALQRLAPGNVVDPRVIAMLQEHLFKARSRSPNRNFDHRLGLRLEVNLSRDDCQAEAFFLEEFFSLI